MPRQPQIRDIRTKNETSRTGKATCKICNGLSPGGHIATWHDPEKKTASLSLPVDASRLAKSQEACRYCKVLGKALDGFSPGWMKYLGEIVLTIEERMPIGVRVGVADTRFEIFVPEAFSKAPWPSIGVRHDVPSHAGTDETFEFLQRCLHDCLNNPQHKACREKFCNPPGKSKIPSRLLDVGEKSDETIKLSKLSPQKSLQYLALSHCWGNGTLFTTTTDNLKLRMSGIKVELLPALFKDAVTIARRLSVRYLWIDALCIVQDSRSDWASESAQMGSIYENAYATIAATSARNSSERLLTQRPPVTKILYKNTAGRPTVLRARKVQDHHPKPDSTEPVSVEGSLANRAWVLQEHVLCSRIIHFTHTEVVFECRTAFRCECRPSPKRAATSPGLIPKVCSAVNRPSKAQKSPWKTWHHFVARYTKRQLTFPSDKLPAISGLASQFSIATDSKYLTGLWHENLIMDLLWTSSNVKLRAYPDGRTSPTVSEHYRGPSFSWASLDGPIDYHTLDSVDEDCGDNSHLVPISRILSSQCHLAQPENVFGEVSFASLTLRGYTKTAWLTSSVDGGDDVAPRFMATISLTKGGDKIPISPDTLLVHSSSSVHDTDVQPTIHRATPTERYDVVTKAPVLCIKIATRGYESVVGLVLSPAKPGAYSTKNEDGEGAFERLGVFECGFESFQGAKQQTIVLV